MLDFYSKYKKIILLSALGHLIAVIFSTGHLHPDEHFQILEFLNYKLGGISGNELPWEFQSQIRPWIQPFLYYIPAKIYFYLFSSPFGFTFILRLISSLFGMYATILLSYSYIKSRNLEEDSKKWIIYLSNLLWIYPFMHARFSSETFGASIFAISLALYFLKRNFLIIGLILGLATQVRFHIGIMAVSLIFWDYCKNKNLSNSVKLLSGMIVFTLIGFSVDYWGYGKITFPAYEYLYQNLIIGKASGYGEMPWWEYFKKSHAKLIPPIGTLILVSFIYYWFKSKKSVITAITLPFFIVHCLISHKEWRFLYPMAIFIPFVLTSFIIKWKHFNKFSKLFIAINFGALIFSATKPAHHMENLYRFLSNTDEKIETLYNFDKQSLFGEYKLHPRFFDTTKIKEFELFLYHDIDEELDQHKKIYILSKRNTILLKVLEYKSCKTIYSSSPKWLISYMKKSKNWAIIKCERDSD